MLKLVVIVLFFATVISLFSGLFFLLKDRSRSHRTANMLAIRVTLSIALLGSLIYGLYSGDISPNQPW